MVNAQINRPSGLIIVFSGLFTYAVKSDDELAALLAHELAHALANHYRESLCMVAVCAPIAILIGVPFGIITYLAAKLELGTLVNVLSFIPFAPLALARRFKRRQEEEADYIALILMTEAGFDPSAAVSVLRKLQYLQDRALSASSNIQEVPQWLSTHPAVS